MPADHDMTNKVEALRYAASDDPLYIGVFYQVELPSFVEHIQAQATGTEADVPKVVEGLFRRYS